MHRVATIVTLVCLLAGSLAGLGGRTAGAAVDVTSLDPDALFAALSGAPIDVTLPGSLAAEDAEVAGYGATFPWAGNVGVLWSDGEIYFNYQVFYTVGAAEDLYASGVSGFGADSTAIAFDGGATGSCAARDSGGAAVETCWSLSGNVVIGAAAPAELGIAADLSRAGVEHLNNVAEQVAAEGPAAPGTSAAERSAAEADVSGTPAAGTVSGVEPSALVAALVGAEMSQVSLPGFMEPEDAEISEVAAGADPSGTAAGGVTITWSGMDEGTIGIFVYADEAAAGAAYAGEQATVEAELGVLPEFETADGLEGFCDVSTFSTSESPDDETCYALVENVVVTGFGDDDFGYGTQLVGAGVEHLRLVVRSISNGEASTDASPAAEAGAADGPAALVEALAEADLGPAVGLPAYLPAEGAESSQMDPEFLDEGVVGAVVITWPSNDPDAFVDGMIYIYVYESEAGATAMYEAARADAAASGDDSREFSIEANSATGTVDGICTAIDEDDDGVGDYDFCATVSGNAFVVAADLTEANDGARVAAAAVEHIEALRGS